MNETDNDDRALSISLILREVDKQITLKKDIIKRVNRATIIKNGKLPSEFYQQLEASQNKHDQIGVKLHFIPSKKPVVGHLLDKLRYKLQELTLFYINKMAADQIRFNNHILHAVTLLAQELEKKNEN